MNELMIFKNDEFGEIRIIEIENEPWFVAKDICEALEIKNTTQAIGRLDEDERTMLNIGRQGNTNIINEYGLYNLILASRKKEAREFKRWITHEVIPSIRKSGGYIAGQETLDADELIQKALLVAQRKIEERDRQLEEQKPKVLFADSVIGSEDSILIRDLAKILNQNGINIGQNRLYGWLRENGYLIKSSKEDRNSPTQKAMNMGLFELRISTISTPYGTKIVKTTLVTGKGQVYFINKFKNVVK